MDYLKSLSIDELAKYLSERKVTSDVINTLKLNQISGESFCLLNSGNFHGLGIAFGPWLILERILQQASLPSSSSSSSSSSSLTSSFSSSTPITSSPTSAATITSSPALSSRSSSSVHQPSQQSNEDDRPKKKKRKLETQQQIALTEFSPPLPIQLPPQIQEVPREKLVLPEGVLERWTQLIESGRLEEADSDVRTTFPNITLSNALCPFDNCSLACHPRRQAQFLNHILTVHVQFKRFVCDFCATNPPTDPPTDPPMAFPTTTKLRRHFRKIHNLTKADMNEKIAKVKTRFETVVASPTQNNSPTDFLNFDTEMGVANAENTASPTQNNPFTAQFDPSPFDCEKEEVYLEDLGSELVPNGLDFLLAGDDALIPEVGSDGTLIIMTFSTAKTFTSQAVHFHCQNHLDLQIQQKADIDTDQRLSVPFLKKNELDGIKVAVFDVKVEGIEHSPLQFIWVASSIMEALEFMKKRGFPPNLGGSDEDDEDFNDYAKKLKKLTKEDKDTLVHHYAFLGQVFSLKVLMNKWEVDITTQYDVTGENFLHVAIREEWPELVRFGISLKREMLDVKDKSGRSPRDLLKLLPDDDECKVAAVLEDGDLSLLSSALGSLNLNTVSVLSRLASQDPHSPLEMKQWNSWFSTLSSEALSANQVKVLIYSLAGLAHQLINTHVASFALFQSLAHIPEVRQYVEGWPLPTHPEVVAFNEALRMKEYLGSTVLTSDLVMTEDSAVGEESLPPRLLVLFQLKECSPAYSTYESLADMGLIQRNQELLEKFVVRREKVLAMVNQTNLVTEAISKIEKNALSRLLFLKASEMMNRRDATQFALRVEDLRLYQDIVYSQQSRELQARREHLPAGIQFEHQEKVLEQLSLLRNKYFDCLEFFAQRDLQEGFKLAHGVVPIHQQMLQICDNSVALVFMGLIKTGKSTLLNTIIGDTVGPSRIDPMTVIPVRYVHDPAATEPVMLVPFFLELNKVTRSIKFIINKNTKEEIWKQLHHIHLRALLEKIDRGLIFRNIYSGVQDVLEASMDIHDLFRLATQNCFDSSLALELPLDWSQGLDSYLTVYLKFPTDFGLPEACRFSVIDTPGVNEAGISKLGLLKIVNKTAGDGHFVAFAVNPRHYNSAEHTPLRLLISRIASTSKIATLVFATFRDTFNESSENTNDVTQGIAAACSHNNWGYPQSSVFLVSAKRKLVGDQMINFLDKHQRKPEFDDQDRMERRVAEEWASVAGSGYTEEEKKEDYDEMSLKQLRAKSERLIKASYMKEPLDHIVNTVAKNFTILPCNKAIEKSLEVTSKMLGFLKQLQGWVEDDPVRRQELVLTCENVIETISTRIQELLTALKAKMAAFEKSLSKECESVLETFRPKIDQLIEEADEWEFRSKEGAERKVRKAMARISTEFDFALAQALDPQKTELEELAREIQETMKGLISSQLDRIEVKFDFGEMTRPKFQKFSMEVDSSESTSSPSSENGTYVFLVDFLGVRNEAAQMLEESIKSLISETVSLAEKEIAKNLEEECHRSFLVVAQAGESFREKEKLRGVTDEVLDFIRNLEEISTTLQGLSLTLIQE